MAEFAVATFSGTDGTDLPTADSNWTEHPSFTSGQHVITDANRARPANTSTSGYYHSGVPASADYEVSLDLYFASLSSSFIAYICGRMSTSAYTYYYGSAQYGTGWKLNKVVGGSFTQLGSTVSQTFVQGSTYNYKLRMDGDQISLYTEGGSTPTIGPITDTSITDANRAGIRSLSTATPSNSVGIHIDNFLAADLTSGGGSVTVTHDLKASITTSLTVTHDLKATIATSLVTVADLLAAISTAVTINHDSKAIVLTEITTAHDLQAAISTPWYVTHGTRAIVATALTQLHDTLADIATLTGYVVNHDTRVTISTSIADSHDLIASVSMSYAILTDTLADISTLVGYVVQQDTRLTVNTAVTQAIDALARVSTTVATSHDTMAIISDLQTAILSLRVLAEIINPLAVQSTISNPLGVSAIITSPLAGTSTIQ